MSLQGAVEQDTKYQFEKMQIIAQLGEGHSATVKKISIQNQEMALKIYKKKLDLKSRLNEINALRCLNQENILKMITVDPEYDWILTELMDKDLYEFVKIEKQMNLPVAHYIMKEITKGLEYLHTQGYVHRDLKLENILVNAELEIKLCDFNFAEHISNGQVTRFCGTEGYIAPELNIKLKGIDVANLFAVDIFALGIIYFSLIFNRPPFLNTKNCIYWNMIKKGDWKMFWFHSIKNSNNILITDQFMELIQKMLDPKPSNRITAKELLQNSYFQDADYELYLTEFTTRRKRLPV